MRRSTAAMGALPALALVALLAIVPSVTARRELTQKMIVTPDPLTNGLQQAETPNIDFGTPGLALPPRYIYPGQPPSDRELGFAANMSALFQNGTFMKMPSTPGVDPMHPRPEHPRPQLYRAGRWESLNGPWQFQVGRELEVQFGADLPQDIIVPFAIESPLSGINLRGPQYSDMIYRRLFTPTLAQPGERILLHVDRADWHATVYVNGQTIGEHKGGYDRFSFDITDAAKDPATGEPNEIIIAVHDDTEWAMHPLGKQRAAGTGGIIYTSTSGIWGDVWTEYVPVAHLTDVFVLSNTTEGSVRVFTNGSQEALGQSYNLALFFGQDLVSTQSGVVGQPLDIMLDIPQHWSPNAPNLYNATIYFTASSGNISQMDVVQTYFGMRKISLKQDTLQWRRPRIMLNNLFTFHFGFLDQGYVPDGVMTYASDADMLADIVFMKSLGANTVRKHIKTESDRWYLYVAQQGLLTWQDMVPGCGLENQGQLGDMSFLNGNKLGWDVPNGHPGCWTSTRVPTDEDKAQWRTELSEIVREHYYSPAVVMYEVFNEAWGQFDTTDNVKFAMDNLDPGMVDGFGQKQFHYMWNGASGWQDWEVGHVFDLHRYTSDQGKLTAPMRNPENKTELSDYARTRAAVLGEFGGVKFPVEGHTWGDEATMKANSDPHAASLDELQTTLLNELGWLAEMVMDPVNGLSGAIFTQPWDVEYENNGLMTYDRAVTKIDSAAWRSAAQGILAQATNVPFEP